MKMNIFSFLISAGLNLLHTPFSDNSRKIETRSIDNSENSVTGSGYDFSIFPFNILKNTPVCDTATVRVGDNDLKFTTIPRGFCSNCCQTKIERDIRFTLFNKAHPKQGVPIYPFNKVGAAKHAGVDPRWHTIIYIHGFSEPSPGESGRAVVDAYLSRPENFNLILLDWSELCPFPWYKTAVENVKLVGHVLKNFVKLYGKSGDIPVKRLHLIGFSLGSHVASTAGKYLQGELRIPRITALDPAFPEFSIQDRTKRLAESDAEYIDVIHTDGGVFGFPLSCGHADFFPNGGKALQPGCQPSYLAQQQIIDQVLACSHVRAWRLYAESVQDPEAFPATKCHSFRGTEKQCNFTVDGFMGYGSNRKMVGDFYLRTSYRSPFGMHREWQAS